MASSLVHHPGLSGTHSNNNNVVPGLGSNFNPAAATASAVASLAAAGSDLSGLEGLVNSADPSNYYHHHHHQPAHPHSHQMHQVHHHGYHASNQYHHHNPLHHHQAGQNQSSASTRSYFEDSPAGSLLGLGSLNIGNSVSNASSATVGIVAPSSSSTSSNNNNESYSPNSTTNNMPSSTVKIKSGENFIIGNVLTSEIFQYLPITFHEIWTQLCFTHSKFVIYLCMNCKVCRLEDGCVHEYIILLTRYA